MRGGVTGGVLSFGQVGALAGPLVYSGLLDATGSYGSGFTLQGVDAMQAGIVLAGATLIGWIGAGVVTGHFLRQTRPTSP